MWKKITGWMLSLLLLVMGGMAVYLNDDYDAQPEAVRALVSDEVVGVTGEDPIRFSPIQADDGGRGIVFYPGGKVAAEAYAPLMRQLAEAGYTVFLAEMPFGLAVFDSDAAGDIMAAHPEISQWYLAGHSLGGAMAAVYASRFPEEVAGLILLAAYTTEDLSAAGIPVLSIYGSEDGVMDAENVAKYRPFLPEGHSEIVIAGGNHAQFGNYGEQAGDGAALISADEQQGRTVAEVVRFIDSIAQD